MKFKKQRFISQINKNGSWIFRVRYGNVSKNFFEHNYPTTRDAYEEAIKYRDELLTQNIAVEKEITLQLLLDESFELFPLREETKRKLSIYFNKYIGDKPLASVTRSTIIMSMNKMVAKSTDDTIKRVLSIWKRLYKVAVLKDYCDKDLSLGVVAPKSQAIVKPKKDVITSEEEFNDILSKVDNSIVESERNQVKTALQVMYYVGLRPGECFALNVDDFADNKISVTKELGSNFSTDSDIIRDVTVRKCKTDASVREIPIPSKLQKILDEYLSDKKGIAFPSRFGTYFDLSNLSQRLHNLNPNFNMYKLRHTLATKLVTNGVDKRTIIEIMGHTNINMSVYYARSNEDLKKKALE